MPDSLIAIGGCAFYECSSLTNVTIPRDVKLIGNNPFSECKLKLEISLQNKYFKVVNNNLYSIDGKTLISYIPENNESEFAIPSGVINIGYWAFNIPSCSNLISIEIPHSVTTIGSAAFSRCSSLTSITIPNSITSIGEHAFPCSDKDFIEIYGGVYELDNLKDIYYTGSKSDWKKIKINSNGNEKLNGNIFQRAKIHYNCK